MVQSSQTYEHVLDLPVLFRSLEYGVMRPEAIFCILRDNGLDVNPEFERLIESQFNSGTLSYTTFVQLVYSRSSGDRRCRKSLPKHSPGDLVARLPTRETIDPLKRSKSSEDQGQYPSSSIPMMVREYISGSMPTEVFVASLSSRGISIIPELEQLIRRHEADNSVTFKDFGRVLLWMGAYNM